jgi:hypothetical protein
LNGDTRPTSVFGQISGAADLGGAHPAPEMSCATVSFANGVRGALEVGKNARQNNPEARHFHKRIAAYGTEGFVEWQMEQWERGTRAGGYESAAHRYREDDLLGQRALTEALFDWLDDEPSQQPGHVPRRVQRGARSLRQRPPPRAGRAAVRAGGGAAPGVAGGPGGW